MNYGSGKTLQSGPNDHVFLYFSDHGAKGLVAFPDTILHAKTLEKTLKEMNTNKQYAKMTIYIEACESGSMFKGSVMRVGSDNFGDPIFQKGLQN